MGEMSFWDRRRAAVQAEAKADAEREAQDAAAKVDATHDGETDEALLARFNLPDPATLKMGDDFSVFMAKGIPTRLRTLALRKLWRSNPVLACVDGLNDYDDDYLTGATGNGVIATTYQVGKGLMAHIDDLARKAEAAETETPPSEIEVEDVAPETPVALSAAEADTPDDEVAPPPTPRRMRFRFDTEETA